MVRTVQLSGNVSLSTAIAPFSPVNYVTGAHQFFLRLKWTDTSRLGRLPPSQTVFTNLTINIIEVGGAAVVLHMCLPGPSLNTRCARCCAARAREQRDVAGVFFFVPPSSGLHALVHLLAHGFCCSRCLCGCAVQENSLCGMIDGCVA